MPASPLRNVLVIAITVLLCAACGAQPITRASGDGVINNAPQISGSALTSVAVGAAYSFVPTASDADGDMLGFMISGKPAWGIFSTATGALTGTPTTAQVGNYPNVVISVSDGKTTVALAAFAIAVTAGAAPVGASSLVMSVAGGGVVTSTGGTQDLSCRSTGGSGCVGTFSGSTGVLTALPDAGYRFGGWRSQGGVYGGCAGTPCTLSKSSATEYVTAVFEKDGAVDPLVLYTDIESGPNTGGENGDGIYLTVFGKNFGAGQLGTAIKVYVNDVEVKRYMNPGQVPVAARGRPDMQQIATQIGLLGLPAVTASSAPSAPLRVKVIVDGRVSNRDQVTALDPLFQVNPGNIYFVSTTGVDSSSTTSGGEFQSPFRSVQKPGIGLTFSIQSASTSGAYGRVRAGDFIVMRGGTYSGVGFGGSGDLGYFMQTLNKSGCPVGTKCAQGGGSSSGPITLMGYPGETAYIDRTNTVGDDRFGGGISAADNARTALGMGAWWNVVNLKIESGYNDGAINTQMSSTNPLGSHWRVVNNEMTGSSCQISTKCRAGGISGSGQGNFWVGNHIHDVYDKSDSSTSLENHGIYINGGGSFEIAYNWIENIPGGNGLQIHTGEYVDDLNLHHNIISGVGKHGINLAEGSRNNILVWNNLVSKTQSAGLRLGGTSYIQGLKLFNNVFYQTGLVGNTPSSGTLTNEMSAKANQMEIRNNIFWPKSGSAYSSGSFSGSNGIYSNNLFYGASAAPSFSSASLSANPLFVNPDGGDFHLQAGSPAIDAGSSAVSSVVKDDFDAATDTRSQTLRPSGSAIDIGAFEK